MPLSHLKTVVAPNMGESLGVFVAAKEPCIGMSQQPPAGGGRKSKRVVPGELGAVKLPRSYAFAVVLCPGDDTAALAEYALRNGVPPDRFHFYHTPATKALQALEAWRGAGLEVYSLFEVDGWGQLNRHFGAHWNNLVHDDHCPVSGCRFR